MRSRGIDGWLGALLVTFGAALGSLLAPDLAWTLLVVVAAVYVALCTRARRHLPRHRGHPLPPEPTTPLHDLMEGR